MKTFVISDLHGCLNELDEILKTIQYNKNSTRVIMVGDLIDRGYNSLGCVRRVRELNLECVLGNHEQKHIRYYNYEKKKVLTGDKNPMKQMSKIDLLAQKSFSQEDIDWMSNLPLTINVKDDLYVLHAGLEPAFDFNNQNPDQIIRCRFINPITKKAVSLNSDRSQPNGTKYWAELWNGKEKIIFGHNGFDRPMRFENGCVGIDTGCVYGGYLTAYCVEENSFIQVKAKENYYEKYKNG